jgi:hypothetical protein
VLCPSDNCAAGPKREELEVDEEEDCAPDDVVEPNEEIRLKYVLMSIAALSPRKLSPTWRGFKSQPARVKSIWE